MKKNEFDKFIEDEAARTFPLDEPKDPVTSGVQALKIFHDTSIVMAQRRIFSMGAQLAFKSLGRPDYANDCSNCRDCVACGRIND